MTAAAATKVEKNNESPKTRADKTADLIEEIEELEEQIGNVKKDLSQLRSTETRLNNLVAEKRKALRELVDPVIGR